MKIKKYIGYGLKAALLLLVVLNLLTVTGMADRLGWLPWSVMAVGSGSMEPVYSRGDLVLIQEVPFDALSVGDDVTFAFNGSFVTHRIVQESAQGYVTQGLVNTAADQLLLEAGAYCGKVVGAVPYLGYAAELLTDAPVSLVLLAVILVVTLYGLPLLKKHLQLESQKKHWKLSPASRALVCLAGLSTLLCLPAVTEAKYVAQLKYYETAVASPLYFSSNYLSREGNHYGVQGWNGSSYDLTLQIRNFDNYLLYNDENTTLNYVLGVKKYTSNGYSDAYTVNVKQLDGQSPSTPVGMDASSFTWADAQIQTVGVYSLAGGTRASDRFIVSIEPPQKLESNTEIYFEFYACTYGQDTYDIELKASFSLTVANEMEFLGERSVNDLVAMVELGLTTNLVADENDERVVLIQWDPDKIYINEFNNQAFNFINQPGCYFKDDGRLYVRLQAYSSIQLEFFKTSSFAASQDNQISLDDFRIDEVDRVGDLPQ